MYTNLSAWISTHKELPVYAAALQGSPVNGLRIKEGIIVIGNESKGISQEILQIANKKITIPKAGAAESLNAAVAAGIILSHVTARI